MNIDIQPFIDALQDEDPHIRARAAEILGKLKDPAAIPALVDAMFKDINRQKFDRGLFFQKSVQDIATDALLEIGGEAATAQLEALLNHQDRGWRLKAISLLYTLGRKDRSQIEAVIRILQGQLQNTDLEMRTAVMEALRSMIVDS